MTPDDDNTPLTPQELRIVNALLACPESRLYTEYPIGKRLSLWQIGRLMGLSRQGVQRIEASAMRKIRLRWMDSPKRPHGKP